MTDCSVVHTLFAFQLHSRQEVVEELVERCGAQTVDERHHRWVVVALVAKPEPHLGVVFLFDMGVVVLSVRTAAGEAYRLWSLLKMPDQVMVDELPAICQCPRRAKGKADGPRLAGSALKSPFHRDWAALAARSMSSGYPPHRTSRHAGHRARRHRAQRYPSPKNRAPGPPIRCG